MTDVEVPTNAELAAQLTALAAANATLTAEVVELRGRLDCVAPPAGPAVDSRPTPMAPAPAPVVGGGPMDRRRMLRTGLAAGAAAATVAVVGSASPAAAANGDPVLAGGSTSATGVTTLSASLPNTATLNIVNPAAGQNIEAAAVYGAAGNSANIGGFGGVVGDSEWQPGVTGLARNNIGVVAKSVNSYGLYASTQFGQQAGLFQSENSSPAASALSAGADDCRALTLFSDFTALRIFPRSNTAGPPTSDIRRHEQGDVLVDDAGALWFCGAGGTPGTWRKLAGTSTAGAFHVLPTPARIYDSRPGTLPAVGSKTKLTGNVARTLSVTVNASGVPADATAVSVTVLLVNAANVAGNFTMWAGGAARPAANTMVWGTGSGRYSGFAISALGAGGAIQVAASASTDVVLDVVGFYR